jgi:multiple sugar transport system substrate-binding protein
MRNPFARRTLPVLAGGLLLALMAACGGGGSETAGSSTAPSPAVAATKAAEPTSPVEISFASWVGQQDGMKRLYAKFQQEHPNITVKFTDVPAEQIETKLTAQIAGGNPPDAAFVDASTVANFASRDALVNLDGYIAGSDVIKLDDYVPAFKEFTTSNGSMYGLPFDGESTGLFYRTDMFQAAGIAEPPKTWDEFTAAAEKLTDPAKKQYGFAVFAPEAEYYWYPWLFQNGGSLLSEDEKTIEFNNEAGKEAARYYIDLVKYAPPDYLNSNSYDARVAFANGQVGMYMAGAWFAGTLSDEFPKIEGKWATAPLPDGKAGCKTTIAGDALIMFGDSEQQDATWKWLEFLSQPENLAEWTFKTEGTLLPPLISLLNSPELVEEKPVLEGFAELMECCVNYNIVNEDWPKVSEELNKQLGAAMFGDQTSDEALDNTATFAQRFVR